MSTTLSTSTPVARKNHQCSWCFEMILIGEKYERWTGIHEGDFQSSAMHTECLQAFRDTGDYEYYPGERIRGSTCEKGCRCDEHTKKAEDIETVDAPESFHGRKVVRKLPADSPYPSENGYGKGE